MVFLKGGERDLFPFNKSELLTLSSYLLRRLFVNEWEGKQTFEFLSLIRL